MAAAAPLQGLCEEALCSVCLEYLEDPVTIECGHNFCRACLTRYWEGSEGSEEVSCPQCRGRVRRSRFPNWQLANIVELTRELSLQEEANTERKGGVCAKHQEPLKLFCKEDEALLCVVCDKSKEHRGHQVVPLEEEAQDYKNRISTHLDRLKKERAKVLASQVEMEEENQQLLKQTKAETKKTKKQFRKLHSFLNEQENLLLAQMEEVEKEILRNRDEHLAKISEDFSSLECLIQEMEQKHQQPPSELLQDVRKILQRYEKREPFQKPPAVPPELKLTFWNACDRNIFLAKKMQHFRDTLQSGSLLQKANVTLDPKTANSYLVLSEDHKSVRNGDQSQDLLDYPERFNQYAYVVGCEGFTAGRHYWEVTVENEECWSVGVARKSVERKDTSGIDSCKRGFWAVGRWRGKLHTTDYHEDPFLPMSTDYPKESFLSLSGKLRRIRVSLNYAGGQVAFHDADTGSHLYTFSGASFSGETLLPFFDVWGKASLTISD